MAAKRYPLKVIRGGFAPADGSTADELRGRYRVGDVVFAELRRPRSPGHHRLAHALGRLVAENLDAFEGMQAHQVLKRLQLEASVGCEEIAYQVPGYGTVVQRIPKSLSFETMDETEFTEVFRGMCRHLAKHYWPDLTPEQVEEMAELMEGE